MSVNWYDVLDVEPTASTDEIRSAWRAAVADLDPTSRRFRLYNQAAEVLLDPARRAAYDEELAAALETTEPTADEETRIAPPPLAAARLDPEEVHEVEEDDEEPAAAGAGRRIPLVPGWLLAGLALVVAGALVVVGVLLSEPSDASVAQDTAAAQAAAEKAIVPILSYDAHHLTQSQNDAVQYMTSGERDQYDKLFSVIRSNAPHTGTVVQARYVASGIVRSGTDRVDVLVFVDQVTRNKQHPVRPVVYKNQVTVSMEKVGSSWLVDNLTTNAH